METKYSDGNILNDNDSVILTQRLKRKGSTITLKRGTVVKKIRLSDDSGELESKADGKIGR
jgi:protein PhnA